MGDEAIDAITRAPTLDTRAAAELRAVLAPRAGSALRIDGQGVEFIGAAALQVLLSARASSIAGGAAFRIAQPSEALVAQWRALGAPLEVLDHCGAGA
jgi:anti-anti-sigma regulatory factor